LSRLLNIDVAVTLWIDDQDFALVTDEIGIVGRAL
jgi:hypothetical protein